VSRREVGQLARRISIKSIALSYKRDVCGSVPLTDLAPDGEKRADTLYSGTRKGVQFPRSFINLN